MRNLWARTRILQQRDAAGAAGRTCVATDVKVRPCLQQAPDQLRTLGQPVLNVHFGSLQGQTIDPLLTGLQVDNLSLIKKHQNQST